MPARPPLPHATQLFYWIISLVITALGVWIAYQQLKAPKIPEIASFTRKGQEAPVSDTETIAAFRWKLADAFNTLAATGDMTPFMNLCVTKLNKLSPETQREMDQFKTVVPHDMAQNNASFSVKFTEWNPGKIENNSAPVSFEYVVEGTEMGKHLERKERGTLNLAKIDGEWLLASGGFVQ